jgi:hypothetical protein
MAWHHERHGVMVTSRKGLLIVADLKASVRRCDEFPRVSRQFCDDPDREETASSLQQVAEDDAEIFVRRRTEKEGFAKNTSSRGRGLLCPFCFGQFILSKRESKCIVHTILKK